MNRPSTVALGVALSVFACASAAHAAPLPEAEIGTWGWALLVPLVFATGTAFAKLSVVFGTLRFGLGVDGVPSALVVTALSALLALVVMQPVLDDTLYAAAMWQDAPWYLEPFARLHVLGPWADFARANTDPDVLAALHRSAEPSLATHVAAFALTELEEALVIAVLVLVPFFVVDVIIAMILSGVGLGSLPPQRIATIAKILLFVTIGGWTTLTENLLVSYSYPAG